MEARVRRSGVLAYLIGAGVAGTLLVFPYSGRSVLAMFAPDFAPLVYVPFFLLPIAWGLWNWLRLRLDVRLGIGTWGGLLGLALALAVNAFLFAEGRWFGGAPLLAVALPAIYALVWTVVIGPLNEALQVA